MAERHGITDRWMDRWTDRQHAILSLAGSQNLCHAIKFFLTFQASLQDPVFPSLTICDPNSDLGTAFVISSNKKETRNNSDTHLQHFYRLTDLLNEFRPDDDSGLIGFKEFIPGILNRFSWTYEEYLFYYNKLSTAESASSNLPPEIPMREGNSMSDFIVNCTVGYRYCNADYIKLYHHPRFFNCYTLEISQQLTDEDRVLLPGPEEGLSLILFKVRKIVCTT